MGQPRRPMGGRCITQTDWKDDQQGNLKEVWLDLLFLTPTEGTGGKLSIDCPKAPTLHLPGDHLILGGTGIRQERDEPQRD